MEIYDFINSKDVRKYLKDQEYQFSPEEQAWIVYQSANENITLEDKFNAWNHIIETTENVLLDKRLGKYSTMRLHNFLKKYMEITNRVIEAFYENENENAVFRYSAYGTIDQTWYEDDDVYSNIEGAFDNAAKEYFEYDVSVVKIKKIIIDGGISVEASFNTKKQLLYIDERFLDYAEQEILGLFDRMWFSIPTPFGKGDIVVRCARYGMGKNTLFERVPALVLKSVENQDVADFILEHGDNSDMYYTGIYCNDDGSVYYECSHNYMDLEYYDASNIGAERSLLLFSAYEKKEINEEFLSRGYNSVILDEIRHQFAIVDYPREWLDKFGI